MDMQDLLDEATTEDDTLMMQPNWPTRALVAFFLFAACFVVVVAYSVGAALASHGSSDNSHASGYTSNSIQQASAVTAHTPQSTHSSGLAYYDPCDRQGIAAEIPCDTSNKPNHDLTGWVTSSWMFILLLVFGGLAFVWFCRVMLSARLDHNRQRRANNTKPSA